MKEERWYLDRGQMEWLSKVCKKISEGKWDRYSVATQRGIVDIMKRGSYTEGQRLYLNTIRRDWVNDFCIKSNWDIDSIYKYDVLS